MRRSVEALLHSVTRWAADRLDVRAVALVGSHARGTATSGSDVDLVVLTARPEDYLQSEGWISDLNARPIATKQWGAITERRLRRDDGLEVDVGIGVSTWAAVDPVDPGTRRVVRGGIRILHDPDHLLQRLVAACSWKLAS